MLLSKIMGPITMSSCSFFEFLGRQVLPEFLRSTGWAIVMRKWLIPVSHCARLMKVLAFPVWQTRLLPIPPPVRTPQNQRSGWV